MVLADGQVLDEKYVIVRALATGSMGEVYLGRNRRIGKEVAVKVMRADMAADRAIVDRFEQEARIAGLVRSKHVVDVYDLGDLATGERYIIMEYIDGESLAARLERERRLTARALGAIAIQIADALAAAHDAGVVHRDLKPENIILTKRDNEELVKLVDFGVSKVTSGTAAKGTLTGVLLGTPMYMSPEQARGQSSEIDHRTDIYSFGVLLYEAISGETPFTGENVIDLLSHVINDEAVPLETRAPTVDPTLAAIVRKAMSKHARDRYQSAAEMRQALTAWQAVFASGSMMWGSLDGVVRVSDGAARGSLPPSPPVPPMAEDGTMRRALVRFGVAGAAIALVAVAGARHPRLWGSQAPAPAASAEIADVSPPVLEEPVAPVEPPAAPGERVERVASRPASSTRSRRVR